MNLVNIEPNTHREEYRELKSVKLDLSDLFDENNWLTLQIDKFLDRIVLFRWNWTGYYNSVSANRRMISAAVLSVWLFIAFIGIVIGIASLTKYSSNFFPLTVGSENDHGLFTIEFRGVVTFSVFLMGSWMALFWREKSSMYKKWSYLANLYNEYLKADVQTTDSTQDKGEVYNKREAILASLCIDILQMRMWSHRSFRTVFKDTLAKAIHYGFGDDEEKYLKCLSDIVSEKMKYGEASKYLSDYQWQLFHSSDFPLKVHK